MTELTEEEVLAYRAYQQMNPLEALEDKILPLFQQKIERIKDKPKEERMKMLCDLEYETLGVKDSIEELSSSIAFALGTYGGPFQEKPAGLLVKKILPQIYGEISLQNFS